MRRGKTSGGLRARIKTWIGSRRLANPIPTTWRRGSGDPARSLRLGALLHLYRGGPTDPLAGQGELPLDQLAALGSVTEDDMHLANACLEVEAWLARANFRRVERLLAADMFGEEEAETRLNMAMKRDDLGCIAQEVIDLMSLGLIL
jgi:hypothetical protein